MTIVNIAVISYVLLSSLVITLFAWEMLIYNRNERKYIRRQIEHDLKLFEDRTVVSLERWKRENLERKNNEENYR